MLGMMKKVLTANRALNRAHRKPMKGFFTTYFQRAGQICISEGFINMLKEAAGGGGDVKKTPRARNTEALEPAVARHADAEVSQIWFNILGKMGARFYERWISFSK